MKKDLVFKPFKTFYLKGTIHAAVVDARSEGDARKAFHVIFNGESIVSMWDQGKARYSPHFPMGIAVISGQNA